MCNPSTHKKIRIPQLLRWMLMLVVVHLLTTCSGRVKPDFSKEDGSVISTAPTGSTKLIRSLGSHSGDNVHCSLKDKAGNLWFGTTGEGVYKYDGKIFRQFTTNEGLYSNTIWCLLEDREGRIWVGTDAGANVYAEEYFSKIDIPASEGNEWITSSVENETPPKPLEIFSMMQDRSGKLWFATLDGVYIYDGQSFTPFVVDEDGKGFKNSEKNNVEYILEDKAGNIWFGGRVNAGVFRYDGKSITKLPLEELSGHDWAWPVLQDKHGGIWFSNWGGAYRYDGESFTCISAKEGPFNEGVWTFLEDKEGFLWLGTRNTGLYRYDGEVFVPFSE